MYHRIRMHICTYASVHLYVLRCACLGLTIRPTDRIFLVEDTQVVADPEMRARERRMENEEEHLTAALALRLDRSEAGLQLARR